MNPSANRISLFALALLAIIIVAGCAPAPAPKPNLTANVTRSATEAIGADILASGTTSDELTVLGIELGMTESQVLDILGPADKQQEFDFGAIRNWEYNSALGLDESGVIFHIRNGFVTRITLMPALNPYLVGNTSVGMTKSDVYAHFGLPDRQYDMKGGRYFIYNKRGLEVYLSGDTVSNYALVYPNRKLPSTATLEEIKSDPFKPKTPRLVMDTTTLCDEGPTQAFNVGTGECTKYVNACAIPDSWIEVKSCEAQDVTREAVVEALRSQQ